LGDMRMSPTKRKSACVFMISLVLVLPVSPMSVFKKYEKVMALAGRFAHKY
jgi:hypothetical protein